MGAGHHMSLMDVRVEDEGEDEDGTRRLVFFFHEEYCCTSSLF